MRRIHASLDLAEAAGQHGPGAGGGRNPASHDDGGAAGAEQPSALDLLMRSRDEEGVGLTRQGSVMGARAAFCCGLLCESFGAVAAIANCR